MEGTNEKISAHGSPVGSGEGYAKGQRKVMDNTLTDL